jgi:hypothetical protein
MRPGVATFVALCPVRSIERQALVSAASGIAHEIRSGAEITLAMRGHRATPSIVPILVEATYRVKCCEFLRRERETQTATVDT